MPIANCHENALKPSGYRCGQIGRRHSLRKCVLHLAAMFPQRAKGNRRR
jgi:hypothetical protein